jgi:formate dehydrogenase subunit delta
MDTNNLIHMANRIGQFFESYPDREEAVEGVATHIRKFWTPRMRELLIQQAESGEAGAGQLLPLVADAIRSLKVTQV